MKKTAPNSICLIARIVLFLQLSVLIVCSGGEGSIVRAGEMNIPCFVYHRFGDERYPSTNIDLATFEEHLQYLKDNEIEVVTLGEAVQIIRGNKKLRKKTVVLTIDDGYESFLSNGMPLLRQYGFKATLFVNTATVGNSGFINWQQLRQLREEGIEIGNHSHSHAHFVDEEPGVREEVFSADLEQSNQIFAAELGEEPGLFSYPYGEYTDTMVEIVGEKGFVAAAAQNSGVISTFSNHYALPRFPMAGPYAKLESFMRKVSMRALPAATLDKPGHLVSRDNPPVLRVRLQRPEILQTKNIQCFVADTRECSFVYDEDLGVVTMRSTRPLQARRTLYTITVPSATGSGGWYWYSHLWIDAQNNEM